MRSRNSEVKNHSAEPAEHEQQAHHEHQRADEGELAHLPLVEAVAALRRTPLREIVASHGYLPAQFLNPAVNLRTDEYGGSPHGRMRVADELLTLAPLSAVAVEPDVVRQVFNDTDHDALWLVAGAPREGANTLEMSDAETAQRHLAAETGVDPERLHLGKVKPDDWPALLKGAAEATGVPFHLLDDGDLSLFKLRAQARQIAVRYDDLRLIVVDYLQLMRAEKPSGSRVEDVSEFSRGLKRLAREMKCPVIAVAQLSRAVEQRPVLL